MTYISDAGVRQAQDFSWQVGGCRSVAELENATLHWLFEHVPCSHASYTDYPTDRAATRLKVIPFDVDTSAIERSMAEHIYDQPLSDHPFVSHYFYDWRPVTPLRMSDLISERQLRATRVYSQVFHPARVTHSLGIINRRASLTDNAGYALMRQGRDFTDDEVALAILVQPILQALGRCLSIVEEHLPAEATSEIRLTPAELDVLRLLATGMTAVAIGHVRRTSPRTVRKHIESIYDKLGVHDRLQAVLYAEAAGIVRPSATHRVDR